MRCEGPAVSYIALDLETTGLEPKTEKIIEIAALRVEEGIITGEFSALVHPGKPLEETIVQLTGITDEMLAGKPPVEEVIREAAEFCGNLPLLGHNILFDYRFLKHAAVSVRMEFEREGIDTLALCRAFMPKEEKRSLENACAYYGISQPCAHRAMADARSAHLLYQELCRRHGQEEPERFLPKQLKCRAKREQAATKRQKEYLQDLVKYHRINVNVQVDELSRSEASRLIDQIILEKGKLPSHSR